MMKKLLLNEWDLEQIEKKGFVQSGNVIIMSLKEFNKLTLADEKLEVTEEAEEAEKEQPALATTEVGQ